MSTRRTFLKSSLSTAAAATAVTTFPSILRGQRIPSLVEPDPRGRSSFLDDPNIKALAQRGVDAARRAGAQFADVRLTQTEWLTVYSDKIDRHYDVTVGVRVLVQGVWGFAAGPVWTADEMVRVAKDAVGQAKAIALGQPRPIELAPVPKVDNQSWTMPVKIDPFTINPVEIMDFLGGLAMYIKRVPEPTRQDRLSAGFKRQDKIYASSEDCLWSQRTYTSSGEVSWRIMIDREQLSGTIDLLSSAGEGWELFRDQPLRDAIDREMERLRADAKLPWKPVDVGKYATVLDQGAVAGLLSETIGAATELDRAMGYEANAGGTSYLSDPLEMFGTFMVGSPLLSVTGNRRAPGSVATVQWDDESVVPDDIALITEGRLTDFATSRESAGWLREIYARNGKSLRSHGCAYAPQGVDTPLVHTPNLVMTPSAGTETLETLIAGLPKGLFFRGMFTHMDFQQLNGLSRGMCYEIKGGKPVARIENAGMLFRTPELWKSLTAIGGRSSARRYGRGASKGEPAQQSVHSVTAVPVALKEATIIDVMRKA